MKTKVIAFRVTDEQYQLLQWVATVRNEKLTQVLMDSLETSFAQFAENRAKAVKRLEAKAKREAKKAASVEVVPGD